MPHEKTDRGRFKTEFRVVGCLFPVLLLIIGGGIGSIVGGDIGAYYGGAIGLAVGTAAMVVFIWLLSQARQR